MSPLFLLLGSNLGDRIDILQQAEERLSTAFGHATLKSKFYETAAWGVTDQPAFLNQVLVYETNLAPPEILKCTQEIEIDLGRIRKERWGPRVLDIDLLFLGQETLISPDLILPHPQLHLRRFTLAPLAEITPDFMHPVLRRTIVELLLDCPDQLDVQIMC